MSDDYEEYRRKVIDAQRQWNYDRSAIYFAQAFVASKFDGQYEDPRIKSPDDYDTLTLAQMVEKVNGMKPELVEAAGTAWMQISKDIKDAAAAFNTEFQKTVGGEGKNPAWGGASGAKAVEAVNNYAERTEPLGTAAHLIGIKLNEMVTGLHQTKALMPTAEPPKDLDGKVLPPDGIMKEGDYTTEEAEDEGRRILRTVYGQVANQTDHNVPVLPAAPKVVDDGGGQPYVPPGTGGGGDDNSGGGGGTGGENGGGTTSGETGGEETGGETTTESDDPSTTAAGTDTQSTPQTTSTPTDTSKAATTGSTGSPTGTGYVPGGSGRSGGGSGFPGRGGGTGGGSSSGGGTPGAGRSLHGGGTPQGGSTPAAASAGKSGAAGAGRMGGMPMGGMGAPGRGGGQDDEKSGQSAIKEYLITQQNGDELTGLDSMPKTVPPVLGAEG
ncbi:hypothetical protein [Nocardia cyriacigeorgica]|uniref:Uncharacterized protein n=1 Tax=Nocardia cyriacigeorgica TaxID=135487 RepID=A0A6P1D472_9NOCA|nr:hypothetical protein [Nocardia cyriacigeorgica]NEW44828.1 hypothetical protein [Nocardia cyriacigeorgica]